RVDVVFLLPVAGPTRGQHGPLGLAGVGRVAGHAVVGPGGTDDDGVEVAVGGALQPETGGVGVPRRHHGHGAVRPGVLDALVQVVGAEELGDGLGRVAEGEIHHLGAV